eukprot:TRINITY_DN11650_c0_g1_i2.p1 TRINITY_DN11650_c0_g1~~TRINITY_DN11650_c0_g1_i2.p1  ORF type:complete len:134 (-),score=16.75 TRINITY_DN11650_c0_g1_i2:13-414(-)
MHGSGVYTWKDGRKYHGQYINNAMQPRGIMSWADGRVYTGDFVDGRRHGEGILTWPDGRAYNGQWHENKQHGTALSASAKGQKRSSLWADGRFVKWLGPKLTDVHEGSSSSPEVSKPLKSIPEDTENSPSSKK